MAEREPVLALGGAAFERPEGFRLGPLDLEVRPGIYRQRVIKEIRGNLLLGYVKRHWPAVRIVYLVRDPIDVVRSQLQATARGMDFDWSPRDVLAEESLVAAAKAATEIEDPIGRASAFNSVAYGQGKFGMISEAKTSLNAVRKAADQIDNLETRASALAKMGVTYGLHLQNMDAAKTQLTEAEALVGQVADDQGKVNVLINVTSISTSGARPLKIVGCWFQLH